MYLKEFYNKKLNDYKSTGIVDNYAKLLSILLLSEINRYKNYKCNNISFYGKYKEEIDEKIKKLEKDFNITDQDYINYMNSLGIEVYNVDKAKIKFIYEESIIVLQWALLYCKDTSPEDAYEFCYDDDIKNLNLRRYRYEEF